MAGQKDTVFKEKITPYINTQMQEIAAKYGKDSNEYRSLELQYVKTQLEDKVLENDRALPYQCEMRVEYNGKLLRGVERRYRRTILVEPTTACAAHCRWCLRGQYPMLTLDAEDIANFAKFCGSKAVRDDLREVLITGGDPFLVPKMISSVIEQVKKHASNIKVFRIATRIPVQDPERVNQELLEAIRLADPIRVEIATHINHPVELTKEAISAFQILQNEGYPIYDQTVLLKGTNDSAEILTELYDELRYLGIEAYYLFHSVPMRGMTHHRTSVQKGIDLMSQLHSSGVFSGRSKPIYCIQTDIGKITPYQGTILERTKENNLLLQSSYLLSSAQERNPSWQLPPSASVDENGYLRVLYPDGNDD